METSKLEQYVDGLSVKEIKKKKLVDKKFRTSHEVINFLGDIKEDEYIIINNECFVLPITANFQEMSRLKFLKTYNCFNLTLPDSMQSCIDLKLDPQAVIKEQLQKFILYNIKHDKNPSRRGIGWRGLREKIHRVSPLFEIYRGMRIFNSGEFSAKIYLEDVIGNFPSMNTKKSKLPHYFRVGPLPLDSFGERVYSEWVNMSCRESIAASIYETESSKYKTEEFRFKYGSVAAVIAKFLEKNIKKQEKENRMLLYPFAILSRDLVDMGYKLCNNVLIERDDITKLNLAHKESLFWYSVNDLGKNSILSGNDLREVKMALESSLQYSKEKV